MHGELTVIKQIEQPVRMSVHKEKKLPLDTNTALIEATLYCKESTFVKNGRYLFKAFDKENKPITKDVNVEQFQAAVDFFLQQY